MSDIISPAIRELLISETERINTPAFIADDPVRFPRRFDRLQDIEITSLLSAVMAWGKRTMICRDIERVLEMMNNEPYLFVKEGSYEDIDPQRNIHRTMFGRHLQWLLRTLNKIYSSHESLDQFAKINKIGDCAAPSWELVRLINAIGEECNEAPSCPVVLPANLATTALKRVNMALRWLVRNDGIVDLGVWKSLTPANLFIPLDVHVGNTARALGLITRKANDRKTTEQLTQLLRSVDPDDPVKFDFALFGIGVNGTPVPKINN